MSVDHNTGLQLRSLIKKNGELELSLAEVAIPEPAADEIWERIAKNDLSERLQLVAWDTPDDLHERLLEVLQRELCLANRDDAATFEQSVGGVLSNGWVYFNRGNTAEKAESWQILSPVRGQAHGIADVNRFVQRHFRKEAHARALQKWRKVPKRSKARQLWLPPP